MHNGDLIKIDGEIIPKILGYKVTYCKLWSSDTGRSMSGENKGTLIGIFPKIELKVGTMTEEEMSAFLRLVNKPNLSVTYYDTEKKKAITASFYANDAADELLRAKSMTHKATSINLIANARRV